MCRIGSIKSKKYIHPSLAFKLMRSQQKGHDNSGFAFVAQDLGGIFEHYKGYPILSLAISDIGLQKVCACLQQTGFIKIFEHKMRVYPETSLDIKAMDNYVFMVLDYPKNYDNNKKENLLLDTRLKLRSILDEKQEGYVYSFYPDVISLKEIGNPNDIGKYFNLLSDEVNLKAKIISTQYDTCHVVSVFHYCSIIGFCKLQD
ncbi:MAG: hypothetical protein IJ669_06730 [Prevotella sp.]|nr:hypothetical protein [Prevotella sp.]